MFTTLIKLSLRCSAYNVPLPGISPISITYLNNTMALTSTRVESAFQVEGMGRMASVP